MAENTNEGSLIEEIEEICVTTLLACALLSALKRESFLPPTSSPLRQP
jgi:hypothetical protein